MRRWISAPLVVALLALAACGDGSDGSGGSDDPTEAGGETLEAEVVALAPGDPALRRETGVTVFDPADAEGAAALFGRDERSEVVAAVAEVDLDGRTLLGGVVHVGCGLADSVVVVVEDDVVRLRPDDASDPDDGDVECIVATVTAALVAVPTAELPAAYREPGAAPATTGDGGGGEVAGDVLLVTPTGYEAPAVADPGLVRDAVDVDALVGRYGVEEEAPALRSRVERGGEVLVAGVVGEACEPPVGGRVVRDGNGIELVPDHGDPGPGPDAACDAIAQALVVVAVAATDVEGVATVGTAPADGPVGVGPVHVVQAVDVGAEPLAVVAADEGGVDAVLAGIAGAPPLDLPPVEDDAVRLVFVVDGCQPGTGELVADLGAGTVRAEVQQVGRPVECEALTPHVVVADLAGGHADLQPVTR